MIERRITRSMTRKKKRSNRSLVEKLIPKKKVKSAKVKSGKKKPPTKKSKNESLKFKKYVTDGSLMVNTPIRPWNTCKVFKSL